MNSGNGAHTASGGGPLKSAACACMCMSMMGRGVRSAQLATATDISKMKASRIYLVPSAAKLSSIKSRPWNHRPAEDYDASLSARPSRPAVAHGVSGADATRLLRRRDVIEIFPRRRSRCVEVVFAHDHSGPQLGDWPGRSVLIPSRCRRPIEDANPPPPRKLAAASEAYGSS